MCDTFAALGNATQDGSVLFAKNSDREPNEAQEIVLVPGAQYPDGQMVKCTYIEIPQVTKTYKVLLSKPFWIWGVEMGSNEYGVTIGNEAVFTRVPSQKEPGLTGMDLLRLALERSTSADEALNVITNLLEEYGQGGNCGFTHPFYYHNSFLICDRFAGWVLETAGKNWAARRIKEVGSISNALTIEDQWDQCSNDLVNYAIQKGWCRNKSEFSFSRCYTEPVFTYFGDGRKRQECTQNLLKQNLRKIDLSFMMEVLRGHAETGDSMWSPDKALLGSDVCMHAGWGPARGSQTVGSMVSRLSPDGDCHWVTGTAAPCLSAFKPVWLDVNLPEFGPAPTGEYDPSTLYWRHEKLHRMVLDDYSERSMKVIQQQRKLEQEFLQKAERIPKQESSYRHEFSQWCFDASEKLTIDLIDELEKQPVLRKNRIYYQNFWNKINHSAKMSN